METQISLTSADIFKLLLFVMLPHALPLSLFIYEVLLLAAGIPNLVFPSKLVHCGPQCEPGPCLGLFLVEGSFPASIVCLGLRLRANLKCMRC